MAMLSRTAIEAAAIECEKRRRIEAAAPELLAACEALVDMYGEVAPYGQSPVVLNARAAIAKARGEG